MVKDDDHPALVVGVKRACEMLSVSRRTLYRLIRDRKVASYCDGPIRKVSVASIKAYVKKKLDEAV